MARSREHFMYENDENHFCAIQGAITMQEEKE